MTREPAHVYEHEFPSGYAGTAETVRLLGELVKKYATHPRIRARVRELFAGIDPLDEEGEIAAVFDHVTEGIRYMPDPVVGGGADGFSPVEYITDPLELDRQISEGTASEDCESMAAYAATLFAASGREPEFKIIGNGPNRYHHCALRVEHRRPPGWVSFDPVGWVYRRDFGAGDDMTKPGQYVEHWTLDGRKVERMRYTEDDLSSALLGDSTSTAETALRTTEGIASVLALIPGYGQIVGGAANLATGIARSAGAGDKKPTATGALSPAGAAAKKLAPLVPPPTTLDPRTWSTGAKVGAALAAAGLAYVTLGRRRRGA